MHIDQPKTVRILSAHNKIQLTTKEGQILLPIQQCFLPTLETSYGDVTATFGENKRQTGLNLQGEARVSCICSKCFVISVQSSVSVHVTYLPFCSTTVAFCFINSVYQNVLLVNCRNMDAWSKNQRR